MTTLTSLAQKREGVHGHGHRRPHLLCQKKDDEGEDKRGRDENEGEEDDERERERCREEERERRDGVGWKGEEARGWRREGLWSGRGKEKHGKAMKNKEKQ